MRWFSAANALIGVQALGLGPGTLMHDMGVTRVALRAAFNSCASRFATRRTSTAQNFEHMRLGQFVQAVMHCVPLGVASARPERAFDTIHLRHRMINMLT